MNATPNKGLYKIGEVCELTDTQPYVLRFWESEFPQLAPKKSRSGQRVYRKTDVEMVERIKFLLYEQGFTIAGARKRLEQEATGEVEPLVMEAALPAPEILDGSNLRGRIVDELREILELMDETDRRLAPSGEDEPVP